jgi:indolepyruvate ferredoxin oxidoreductase
VAVLNTAEVPTATMLRHQGTPYPLAAGLRSRIARATRAGDMVTVDAQAVAERLTGDHLAANLVLVGAAFQAGLLPFGWAELAEAVRLNGVDVAASLAAIAWGRAAVTSPDIVTAALVPPGEATHRARTRGVPTHLEPAPEWPDALRQVVRVRTAELIDFQNERVARDYLTRVRDVAVREHAVTNDPRWPITDMFARGLYSLVAIKDEYEVARLHLLDEEQDAFARAFPGARRVYMLKPPLLARLGLRRKIKLVRSARPAFRLLRAGRRLRGTPLDLFGWSADRREERQFHAEYLGWVATALDHLTPGTATTVGAVVNAANEVHGYAHVRAASMAEVRTRTAEKLTELSGTPHPQQARHPVAG